ncbi:CBO0543 family protein [Paenibacillus sp.]|uniref:CBO0543 family protein n=1 Tax=Paenibacillus sp. TaxID=58172 RepID=UPI002D23C897|nr:CBO0543 family protein [Paenibacillus sp.]HZG84244.1 CBO0543 family protein [Paenibacillus sp.]
MEFNWALEYIILYGSIAVGAGFCIWIIRKQWRQYGLLFLLSAAAANALCYIFVNLGFYAYPVRELPQLSPMPFLAVTAAFPAMAMFGVRYSPRRWPWKIPFYWGIVHLGVLAEVFALQATKLIRYQFKWDTWDSYTWWWLYLLLFEWVGGRIVAPEHRKPIAAKAFQYGRWAWAAFHAVVIVTIFLAGYFLGRVSE